MGFGFAAPDYIARAGAGLPIDPSAGDQSVAPAIQLREPPVADPETTTAPAPQAAPRAAPVSPPQALAQPYQPSFLDILQGVVFNHQSPAEAALAARQRDYQNQLIQRLPALVQTLPPDQQRAAIMSPGTFWPEYNKRWAPITAKGGETVLNAGPGGAPVTAPLLTHSDQSDAYGTQLPGGYTKTGSGGGQFTLSPTGAEINSATGLTGGRVALPQLVPITSSLADYLPAVARRIGGAPGSNPSPPSASAATLAAQTQLSPVSATPAAAGLLDSQGRLDPAAFTKGFILPHEGGWNARDLNGYPTKFGINQKANPQVDVANLKPDDAVSIYTGKYFPASGSANLPPALAAVNFDTSIINPRMAAQFLSQAGGDPSKYMDLRDAWMSALIAKNPAAQKYAQAWSNRNADLRALAAQLGGVGASQPAPNGQPQTTPNGSTVTTLVQGHAPRPLTDPQERARYGISAQDRTPYVIGPEGPKSIGSDVFGPEKQIAYTAAVTGQEPYKNYQLGRGYLGTMQTLMKQPGGFADLGLIENAGKTVNPTVAIRPNMIEQYSKETGWPDWLTGEISSVVNHGGHLTQQGRNALMNIAQANVQSHWEQLQPILKKVDHDAARYGVTREDLIPDLVPMPGAPGPTYPGAHIPGKPQPPAAQPSVPVVGEVRRGYQFRGGNPADPKSWAPAQAGASAP